jgi:DNA-directed RNA polymerase specialized sigma24 family protein
MREDAAAFGFTEEDQPGRDERMAKIRALFPKAYEKWTDDDDNLLTQKFGEGMSVAELAEIFQRQPSAIRSRLAKLGLI